MRGLDGWIELDFPVEPAAEIDPPGALAAALGIEPQWAGRNRFDHQVGSEDIVRSVTPDFGALARARRRPPESTDEPKPEA